MKLNVAVCDANIHAQAMICGSVQTVLQDMGYSANTTRFSSGEALLQELERQSFHIVALDVVLPDMDGITLGRRLRAGKKPPQLVYISEQEDKIFEAQLTQPLGFVRKREFLTDLVAVLELFDAPVQDSHNFVNLSTRQSVVSIAPEDIRYVEGCRNYQLIHLKNSPAPVEIKMTMERIEGILSDFGFVRIHRGYLVNHGCIQNISYDQVLLTDGLRLPVGQSKIRTLRQKYSTLQKT